MAPSPASNPFLALRAFTQDDAARFFGRNADLVLVESRLVTARTTLLFAASGVGKTSFLNAGLIPARMVAGPVAVHRAWAARPPLEALQASLITQHPRLELASPLEQLRQATRDEPGEFLLVLDQFEEVFQYWHDTRALDDFAAELGRIAFDASIEARLVISMREDFLGELSLFDNLIPDLFNNAYRLKHPTRSEAEDIVRRTAASESVDCGGGVSALLEDLSSMHGGGRTRVVDTPASSRTRVPMSFLQVVCYRIWERDLRLAQKPNSSARFLETYAPGRAHHELEGYCSEKLDALDLDEKSIVSAALGFLMTPGGVKMAYPLDVLAAQTGIPEEKLAAVLRKLATPEIRMLRELPPGGRGNKPWFELYHDLYAEFLAGWKRHHDEVWKADAVTLAVANAIETFYIEVNSDETKKAGPRTFRISARYADAHVATRVELRAPKGQAAGVSFGKLIAAHERIKNYTNFERGSLPADAEMTEFGRLLFDTLFHGEVRRLYDVARSRSTRLRIVLTAMDPWLAEKPWEFCYDAGRQSYIATGQLEFVRGVMTAVPSEPILPSAGPLRILVASGQPVGDGQFSVDQELAVIRRGFESLISGGLATVDVLPRATPSLLHAQVASGQFSVLHIIAQGVFDERTHEGALMFDDQRGGTFLLRERVLQELVNRRGLCLLFLSARTNGGGRADFNKGLAQSLMSRGLPALVANQYAVIDASATTFAQFFYRSLALGLSLGEAAREARVAVSYSLSGELIDWAVPVLYARDASQRLCHLPARERETLTRRLPTAPMHELDRPVQIATWDCDDAFPGLEGTLSEMSNAQSIYGFKLIDLSPPMDVWDLQSEPPTPFLWAERLAQRLQGKPGELGVNLLICLTTHWIRDADWLYLMGWWPDHQRPSILVVSTAGIDSLAPEGRETNRVIANVVVVGLAGFFGGLPMHATGVQSCPLAFGNRRKSSFTEVKKFDAACRQKLKRRIPNQLPGLEALLKLYV